VTNSNGLKIVSGASLLIAILQSICTFFLTVNGIRLAVGLTSFVLASSLIGPLRWFHQDAIRIPMLIVATAGAILDLGILLWTSHLRNRPAAQWRRSKMSANEKRSRGLQFALALVTLVLVGTEAWTHHRIHGTPHPAHAASPQASSTANPIHARS